jgi:hypothetical protein
MNNKNLSYYITINEINYPIKILLSHKINKFFFQLLRNRNLFVNMTAEIVSNVQKSSSQLLFFDTLTASNFSSDELPTECIRFHQRVVLSEIRVVPKHFRPFKGSRKNDHVG